jgi:hypothetical protein
VNRLRWAPLLLLAGCATAPPPAPPAAPPDPPAPVDDGAVRRLLALLRSDDIDEREQAVDALGALGPRAEAALREALAAEDSAEVRARIETALGRIEDASLAALPAEGLLGRVRIAFMHAVAWENPPAEGAITVSSVWSIENRGDAEATVRVARARVVHAGRPRDVRITGTKGEADPEYRLPARSVKKPALKAPETPPVPAGDEVWAVIDFADGAGRTLRLRTAPAAVERVR